MSVDVVVVAICLHDALPICNHETAVLTCFPQRILTFERVSLGFARPDHWFGFPAPERFRVPARSHPLKGLTDPLCRPDRKSTRQNSSQGYNSYDVVYLHKK